MPNPSPMSMADFAGKFRDKMRDTMPEVDSYNDIKVFNMAVKSNPELEQIVANPRYNAPAAAAEQYKTKDIQRAQLGPMRAATEQFPTVGAMIGGTLGTGLPGYGTAIGGGLGAYGGTNLEHFANQLMGIDSPNQSFGSTQQDATMQGLLAGGTNAAMQAISEGMVPAQKGANAVRNYLLKKAGGGWPGKILGSILPDFSGNFGAEGKVIRQIPTVLEKDAAGQPYLKSNPPGYPVHEAVGEEVGQGGVRMEGQQGGPPGPAGHTYTEGQYSENYPSSPTRPKVPRKAIGPAQTRFTTEANANPDARALESPEAITESKIKATIDAIEKENAPRGAAPKPGKSEEDVLSHYAENSQTMGQTTRTGATASTPLVKKGSTVIIDTNAATPDAMKRIIGEGFKVSGITPDGHIIFKN